ncbi:MAG: integration host factor subunit beta [Desulforhopalus sp.]|nr:integration host factor subunit beta [Desulforhopalus sp.]
MNKSDLIEALALDQNLPIKTTEAIVATVLDTMTETLVEGGNVEIRGFGSFTVREYQPYDGRNPKTGQKLEVKSKKLPFFEVANELREAVDRSKS